MVIKQPCPAYINTEESLRTVNDGNFTSTKKHFRQPSTMLGLAVIASLLLVSAAQTKPSFCRDLDCPKYTVLRSFDGYELRRYEMSQWVATRDLMTSYDALKNSNMFYKLFHYISGKNTVGMKIPMTAPVLRTFTPGVGKNNKQTVMEMHFMIPHNMQPYPPSPTDPTVYITMLPALDVYVKSFGGFTNHRMNLMKVAELKNEINNRNLYYGDHFYTAGYDGPSSSVNRHNEVWLVAKN